MGNVVIAQNIKRTSERIDPSGNIINPRTKQIIQNVAPEYVEPVVTTPLEPVYNAPQAPITNFMSQGGQLSIQDQITQARANLAQLEELKKLKIAEMKATIELLENE